MYKAIVEGFLPKTSNSFLKAIILYTKERREYLRSLSDIREIVDIKPEKREAKKTNKIEGE